MSKLKMTALDAGPLSLEKSFIVAFAQGRVDIPTTVGVFEHADHGVILWDTGIPEAIADPDRKNVYWAPGVADMFGAQDFGPQHTLRVQLDKLGIQPGDVKYVVYSHLHLDHTGGAELFPDATHVVQRREMAYAFCPDPWMKPMYVLNDLQHLLKYDVLPLDGDTDLFGDGTFRLIATPGHAPGHQSLLVELPHHGRVLLGGDVAHQRDQYENHIPMAWGHCLSDLTASRRRVAALERGGVRSFFCHEGRDFAQLPQNGTYWD